MRLALWASTLIFSLAFGQATAQQTLRPISDCVVSQSREEQRSDAISVERVLLAGVPAILRVPPDVEQSPIILWHGLGPPGDKDALMKALPLDGIPAIKVYLDLPLFGDRLPKGGLAELAERQSRDYGMEIFAPVVLGAAEELPAVFDALKKKRSLPNDEQVSLFGFSAGGAAVLLALAERSLPIRNALVLNGPNGLQGGVTAFETITGLTYSWTDNARSVAARTDAVRRAADIAEADPRPSILLIHGRSDEMIPFESSAALYDALRPFYRAEGNDQNLELDLRDGLAHHWALEAPEVVDALRDRIAEWFYCQ